MDETRIQLAIIKFILARGWVVGKTRTMGVKRGRSFCFDPYTFRGFPDLCAFIGNTFVFIEVKSKTGCQSEDQKKFQRLAEKAGIPYILVRSVKDVEDFIKSIGIKS